jgi:hypothetical protein
MSARDRKPYDPGSGPGYDSFVYIDKARRVKEEIARAPELSNPAEHLVADLKASLGDFFDVVENGEKSVADSKVAKEKWEAEITAAHTVAVGALNEAREVEVESRAFGGFKERKPIITDLHFTTKRREAIRNIHDALAGVKFHLLSLHPGAWATELYLRFVVATPDGNKLIFYIVADELSISGLRASRSADAGLWPPLHKSLLRARDGNKLKR